MKEVIIVHKTHLDLGFTDYAESVRLRYMNDFIPKAIDAAEKLNSDGEKRFVWTTGSWLIKEALECGGELRRKVVKALKNGDIAAHALPFTTHTELLDKDIFEYGLSLIDGIDAISGVKTVAAKMTDVPGHTAAIVPLLAAHGIKLLHIGINTAAAFPNVPECFLWKSGGAEIVVIYSDGYGGTFECPFTDKILCFEHASDNCGVKRVEEIARNFERIKRRYPDCKVRAGRIDDVADALWEARRELPVVESEIGDTWIHGAASDPYKTGAMRTLMRLKDGWLERGLLTRGSDGYRAFADALLCCAEHTWGGDMKVFLEDTEHYRKNVFAEARKRDRVRYRNLAGDFPFRIRAFFEDVFGLSKHSYSRIEKSWQEQRGYIDKAVAALPSDCKAEAEKALAKLRPEALPSPEKAEKYVFGTEIRIGEAALTVNESGGFALSLDGDKLLDSRDRPLLTYTSYGTEDLKYYSKHYLRHRQPWAVSDNLRPGMKKTDCLCGSFVYGAKDARMTLSEDAAEIVLLLSCGDEVCDKTGAPRGAQAIYRLNAAGLTVELALTDKDAVRTPESLSCSFYPIFDTVRYVKLGSETDPANVVSHGNRKLSAIERAVFGKNGRIFRIESVQAALAASEGGNILRFDDSPADIASHGLSFVLHDNVWGTNFPLWYEENSAFTFTIS